MSAKKNRITPFIAGEAAPGPSHTNRPALSQISSNVQSMGASLKRTNVGYLGLQPKQQCLDDGVPAARTQGAAQPVTSLDQTYQYVFLAPVGVPSVSPNALTAPIGVPASPFEAPTAAVSLQGADTGATRLDSGLEATIDVSDTIYHEDIVVASCVEDDGLTHRDNTVREPFCDPTGIIRIGPQPVAAHTHDIRSAPWEYAKSSLERSVNKNGQRTDAKISGVTPESVRAQCEALTHSLAATLV
ncbi:hypothetical protein LMH87_006021 [Akanthomyces muscarius]|uniref:Uncharacterized protein n=1 Tax=Akanthomyces muscarius TaxID=2231603 RepID=A0A9W8QPZ8_AKAMU|nr:hypothetical protein LMH87_006021 [Akanthomyces muscarius]KAJ4164344.1 hypothetical protein LMH87_006021 [Akanthomyces muscarius]